MHKKTLWTAALVAVAFGIVLQIPASQTVYSQGGRERPSPEVIARRIAIENELQSIAIVERKLMIPMRDGTRIATDVYRPKERRRNIPRSLCAHPITSITGTFATALHEI